jgi:hypothetical protein
MPIFNLDIIATSFRLCYCGVLQFESLLVKAKKTRYALRRSATLVLETSVLYDYLMFIIFFLVSSGVSSTIVEVLRYRNFHLLLLLLLLPQFYPLRAARKSLMENQLRYC